MTPGPFANLISDELGQVLRGDDGRYDIVLERRIARPLEKVWAAITIPERIADWFTEADLDLRVGGHYRLIFPPPQAAVDGVILELEPLRRLAHTWPHATHPDSIVRYMLEPHGDGCRLILTQTALGPRYAGILAGWHVFLEAVPGAADGTPTPWRRAREAEILAHYRRTLPKLQGA